MLKIQNIPSKTKIETQYFYEITNYGEYSIKTKTITTGNIQSKQKQ